MSSINDQILKKNVDLTRRRFVQGLTIGAALAGVGPGTSSLLAAATRQNEPHILRGTDFKLTIGEQAVNFTGTPRIGTTVNGSIPAPILHWREGDIVTIQVKNLLREASSIHWHGLIVPSEMDGVPGIANEFKGIKPGETFTYQFPVSQSGTYWYHSHSGFQEQTGLYGAIVIDPVEPEPFSYDRDYVVMLSDWTDEDPFDVYAKLKKLSHYYNFNERTHTDLMENLKGKGLAETWNERKMWNRMRMSQRDLSDVTGYTYTFLTNGMTPKEGWTGLFKNGEKLRLRFINGSAMTFFDVRIPGLKLTVVTADGQYIQPVTVDEFRIGVGETYDIIVEPNDDAVYTIFAQDIARSGYARGTLTPDPSLTAAAIPEMDPVSSLEHEDMGMNMQNHAGHSMVDQSGHDMVSNSGNGTLSHTGHNMPSMKHSGHRTTAGGGMKKMRLDPNPSDFTAGPAQHASTEYGPQVDMRAEAPRYRLDDPGVGLRNNGRRVLTYADLRSLRTTYDQRAPDREMELHLTGNMGRYMWSIDGVKHADAKPLRWKLGERLRITFVNDTMMNHPMHLHGMWSDVETGDNNYLPRRHTVVVQPGSRISFRVTVDAEGGWAFHCHLLYHMPGMFRTVIVS